MPPTFAQLGVPEDICRALARDGITEPFEIQSATIADALAGRDVCGRAPTGSGKTIAFGIPLVVGIDRAKPGRPHALVLAPTRELAEQINTVLRSFSGRTRIGVVYGGVGYGAQFRALRQGVEILVACPGRLEDLIGQGVVNLSAVTRVVLDEADRMADMGFMPAVRRLLDQTSNRRQTLLFSATLDSAVAKVTHEYQRNPVYHEIGDGTPDVIPARHLFWNVAKNDRTEVAAAAIDAISPTLVFCRTRHGADRLAKRLGPAGINVVAIHGGRSQNQRTRALADFSSGRVKALVATDVAARGIHVDGVALILHHDPPVDHKTYVHRSGRTARAGHGGVVLSFVQPDQVRDFRKLQRAVGLDQRITTPDTGALFVSSSAPGTEGMAVRVEDLDTRFSDERERAPARRHAPAGGRRRRNRRSRRGGRRLLSVS